MKRLYSSFLLTILTIFIHAQDYSINNIPQSLMEDADAVVRVDNGYFKILSVDKALYEIKHAVTILNEDAENRAYLVMGYDKLSSLFDIEVNIYDENGKRIRKVKSGEINDRSAYSDNLFSDSRIKYVDGRQEEFPYTIEYSYTKKYNFLYTIPNWAFSNSGNISVVSSKCTLEYPVDIGARYKENNFDGTKAEKEEKGNKIIQWEMKEIPVSEYERYGPPQTELTPNLTLGVAKFSFEGYEGDMSTWDGLAKWQLELNKGRDNVSPETIDKLNKLIPDLSRQEKIETVYKYVQKNTRYVSIQEGIGGLQPFPASVVDEVGYGDCKALTNYTKSLLKAVGIDAYYTKIYAGSNPSKIDPDFPSQFSNHVILAVPNEGDTIWLECTSQTNPMGYLGKFTGDREALLINESGGHIVKTTSYSAEGNNQTMAVDIKVDENGHANVKSNTTYQGIMADGMLYRSTQSYDDQKEFLENRIDIPTFEILDFKIERNDQDVVQYAEIWVNKLLSKSGTRLFLQPNVMNKNYFVPLKYKERLTDIMVRSSYHEYDTVNFELPKGYRIEASFPPVKIESEFGDYSAEIIANEDGKFQYVRHFFQKKGRFKAANYSSYLDFHKKIVRADKKKIALISGT